MRTPRIGARRVGVRKGRPLRSSSASPPVSPQLRPVTYSVGYGSLHPTHLPLAVTEWRRLPAKVRQALPSAKDLTETVTRTVREVESTRRRSFTRTQSYGLASLGIGQGTFCLENSLRRSLCRWKWVCGA
jgi:hypothetical protein